MTTIFGWFTSDVALLADAHEAIATRHVVLRTMAFICILFVFNGQMESEIGEANTHIFILGWFKNCLIGILFYLWFD
jgi:hypothetical protein